MFWYMFPVWDVLCFVYCIVSRSRIKVFARRVTILTLPTRVGFAFINDCSDNIFLYTIKNKIYAIKIFQDITVTTMTIKRIKC